MPHRWQSCAASQEWLQPQTHTTRADAGSKCVIAVMSAGAYGAVQACTYNTRPLVPEVLVKDHDYAVIRARESYETMIQRDVMPDWL